MNNHLGRRPLLLSTGALALLGKAAVAQSTPKKLTVLLDWFINPDHAPLVVGVENGAFARAGLNVELIAPADPNDPPKLVAAKQADIAVYYQRALHMAVDQGLPLVRFGTLVPTPLTTLIVLESSPIRSIADLRGKRIGFSVGGSEETTLGGMLEQAGLKMSDVESISVNFALSSALMSGQVDAIVGGFRNFELHQLAIEGRPGRAFFPERNGVPNFEELIYVTHTDRRADPDLRRFLDVTAEVTRWLIDHPEEGWALFIKGRPEVVNELNRRAWSDTLPRFTQTPATLNAEGYSAFANYLAGRGVIRQAPPVDHYAVEIAARP